MLSKESNDESNEKEGVLSKDFVPYSKGTPVKILSEEIRGNGEQSSALIVQVDNGAPFEVTGHDITYP